MKTRKRSSLKVAPQARPRKPTNVIGEWVEPLPGLNRAWAGKPGLHAFAVEPFSSRSRWKVYGVMPHARPDWLAPWLPELYPVPLYGTDRTLGEAATRAEGRGALLMAESIGLGVATLLLSCRPVSWSRARELMHEVAKLGWPGVSAEVTAGAILALPLGAPIPDQLTAHDLLALVARAAMLGGWDAGPKLQRRRVVRGLWDGQRWARIMVEASRVLLALPAIDE